MPTGKKRTETVNKYNHSPKRRIVQVRYNRSAKARRTRSAYVAKNWEYIKERDRKWRKKNRRHLRDAKLRKRLGITLEHFESMEAAQSGLCAICGQPETTRYRGKMRALCVDHCHETGKVRGLLCNSCNAGIGKLRDNAALLRVAATYLESYT